MNFLPRRSQGDRLRIDGVRLHVDADSIAALSQAGRVTLGMRPEYVASRFGDARARCRARGQGAGYRRALEVTGKIGSSRGCDGHVSSGAAVRRTLATTGVAAARSRPQTCSSNDEQVRSR